MSHPEITVPAEAFLESLGHGLFNTADPNQVVVLTELDALNDYAAVKDLLSRDISWFPPLLTALLEHQQTAQARALWQSVQADTALNHQHLKQLLEKKKNNGSLWQTLEQLTEETPSPAPDILALKYLVPALANTVQDYRETRVGKSLMAAAMQLEPPVRHKIWESLNPPELHLLANYLPEEKRQPYWLDLPAHQLSGVLHEMKRAERIHMLGMLLQVGDLTLFQAALKGLYHMADGISEFSDTRPVSEQGDILKRLFQKRPDLTSMSPELLAHAVYVMSEEDQDRCIASLFKRGELSETQVRAIDTRFQASNAENSAPGTGLKHLIESMHNHEGLWSLSASTSRSGAILSELDRLGLDALKKECAKAKI